MVECSSENVKLSDKYLKKLKTAVEHKTGTTLKISLKILDGNDLPHQLLLTAFNNNMSSDLTLSKAHISKRIQSAGFSDHY